MGADETVVKMKGERVVVGFVTDAETGEVLGMEALVDRSGRGFLRWLRKHVERFGVESVVTDDLSTYKPVVEELGLDHQVCIAHVRKNVYARLLEVEGWEWAKALIWRLMRDLPEDGGRMLLALERRVRDGPALRRLVVELCEKWRSLTCFRRVEGMPQTNNSAERCIGRSKIRYRTVRGYGSDDGMMNGLGLTQWVWRGEDGLDVSELIAA